MNRAAYSILAAILIASTALAQAKPNASPATPHSPLATPHSSPAIPLAIHARILQLEDERDPGGDGLIALLEDKSAAVRERAALALGRIGDARAIPALVEALQKDQAEDVRLMAAFALGEIEDSQSMPALLAALELKRLPLGVSTRIIEALGKVASLPSVDETKRAEISARIERLTMPAVEKLEEDQRLYMTLAITALMRLRSPSSVVLLSHQLRSPHAEIRAAAANALFRLRRPLTEAVPALLVATSDSDVDVRANTARALGAAGDRRAFDPLVKLLADTEARVRVSAVRGLQALGDRRAVAPLIAAGESWMKSLARDPSTINLLLEVATALGELRDPAALPFLERVREATGAFAHPEIEIALARLGRFTELSQLKSNDWRLQANLAAGYGASANEEATAALKELLERADKRAVPAVLRALAQRKAPALADTLRRALASPDLFIRATAASLLARAGDDASARDEATLDDLIAALSASQRDGQNDAQLAIIDALSRFRSERAIEAVRGAASDRDHLVRRAARVALKAQGVKVEETEIGPVRTGRKRAFYERIARSINRPRTAIIETERGAITLELFAADAPLTVENFTTLARRGFFNGIAFHRVVANFVIQGGDPRGDGEGGPGHQIRCEINLRPYGRGALGMALAGKDTGGSQFFITHSPQPHLDGGYTVFGRVTRGQDAVDRIARGDRIRRVTIR